MSKKSTIITRVVSIKYVTVIAIRQCCSVRNLDIDLSIKEHVERIHTSVVADQRGGLSL